ncbi:hypothetical protein H6G41_19155 [Tolypothrix sp. FACHB-123]|uniref:PspA/IM30 family protein n=1 Tax=Tolypothrix sp. FACHB-123 TaxID=2692868 RepID=UPI001687CC14|nr:hypothetical protein [Tolypothrix sp. FACHB-123]MBD2356720.1 hypothetical protein [Tolypothrix sp. FACHB-123]
MGLYEQNQSSQDALQQLRQGTSHSTAAQKIAQLDYAKAQAKADKWEQEYQLALKGSNQDLIGQTKFQKERYQAIASKLKTLVEGQQLQVDAIKSSLNNWEKKVSASQNEVLPTFLNIDYEDIDDLQLLKEVLLTPNEPQNKTQARKDNIVLLAESLHEIEETLTQAVEHQEKIKKDFKKAQQEATYWNEKVQTALINNDDDLALQAVVNKKAQSKIVFILQTQLQQQKATVDILVRNLIALENIEKLLFITED